MSLSAVITGKLSLSAEDGQTAAPFDLSVTLPYTKKAQFRQVYDAVVTDDAIDFGTLGTGGAKLLLVKCPVGACTFKLNGTSPAIPMNPGGYQLFVNSASAFVTSLTVTTTGAATVEITALG